MSDPRSWVDWFLTQPRARYFVRIDEKYLSVAYNYYGLKQKVNKFQAAYELICTSYVLPIHADMKKESEAIIVEKQAEMLYGLLHARYLMTKEGAAKMMEKWKTGAFPSCPRYLCHQTSCIPYGVSAEMNEHPVKMFCPCCSDVYNVKDIEMSKIDGAFFGPSWIHTFMKANPEIVPHDEPEVYVPRIFGIKISDEWDDVRDESSTTT